MITAGFQIRAARAGLGWSQAELAGRAGIHAKETGRFPADVRGTVDRGIKEATDPRQSPGAAFANAPAEKEFQIILQARDPGAAARSLARQAARDKTGQATRDLKAAALDHLIGKASRDAGLSGKAIREAMNDPRTRGALAEILTPAEMRRSGRITGEIDKTAMAYQRPPKVKAQRALKDRAA